VTTIENQAGTASGQAPGRLPGDLREGYAEIGDQRLPYVEAGQGPLIVLLHGFPEFWYAWRQQIGPLAAAGFRVVAPDTRGYNLLLPPSLFEHPAAELSVDDSAHLCEDRRQPDHIA